MSTALATLQNQDSSFFEITSPNISSKIFTEDIISFSYTEEIHRYNTGSLQIYDPDHYYSKVLRYGAQLNISFGYRSGDPVVGTDTFSKNTTQLFGASMRTGIKAYVQNPKGNAGSDGVVTFNCSFYGSESLMSKEYTVHKGMTRSTLVTTLLTGMGVVVSNVNFNSGSELLSENKAIFQRETNYRLLLRLAREWRCIFRISQNSVGVLTAIFISPQYLDLTNLSANLSGALGGDSVLLEYQNGSKNVIEYSWENHQGKSGAGDNVRIVMGANGKPSFIRYQAEGDTVKAYKLNTDRIKERLKNSEGFSDRFAKLKEWVSTSDFESVKWAFDPVEIKTAPQGLGYSMNVKMLGNPLLSAPLKIFFGDKGFPVFFTPKTKAGRLNNFYCNSVTHNIDRSGYKMDLKIADAYTATGGMLVG